MSEPSTESTTGPTKKGKSWWQHVLPWAITIACFGYLYSRIAARVPEGSTVVGYLADVFSAVNWIAWLGVMVPYSWPGQKHLVLRNDGRGAVTVQVMNNGNAVGAGQAVCERTMARIRLLPHGTHVKISGACSNPTDLIWALQ